MSLKNWLGFSLGMWLSDISSKRFCHSSLILHGECYVHSYTIYKPQNSCLEHIFIAISKDGIFSTEVTECLLSTFWKMKNLTSLRVPLCCEMASISNVVWQNTQKILFTVWSFSILKEQGTKTYTEQEI